MSGSPARQRLVLRRGTVVSCESDGFTAEVTVDVGGERRPATSYTDLTGPVEPGDDVVVNTQARDLGLGSGGVDVVHANLSRGLDGQGVPGAHVMKLNYTSLQHAVEPVEERAPPVREPLERPVAVISLHGQLPCVAWSASAAAPQARIGYVQTAGGALPGGHSRVVRDLVERGLLAGHITAAPTFGGDEESITVAGGLHAGLTVLGWDAAVAGPGPGILGTATELGHGGLAALDTAHAALVLGCPAVLVPRMSAGDPRQRHHGLSHHTATVLRLLLGEVTLALPEAAAGDDFDPGVAPARHARATGVADVDGYRSSGLPARTMGRSLDEDELFFRAALAGGSVLGAAVAGASRGRATSEGGR